MKRILQFCLLFFPLFACERAHAQIAPVPDLNVELRIPDKEIRWHIQNFKVPAHFIFTNDSVIGGGFATVDCIDCELTASYEFFITSLDALDSTRARMGIFAAFDKKEKCNYQKEVVIKTRIRNVVKMKCGVKIIITPLTKRNMDFQIRTASVFDHYP